MIRAIILAAGQSSRMGRSKALLPCGRGGPSFVARLIATLRESGLDDVLVVGRPDDDALRGEVEAHGARFVDNPRHEEGQLSSLLAGLNVADRPGVRAVLVTPVDAPLIAATTVARLTSEVGKGSASIVRPSCGGKHGHPVLFTRAMFDALRHADPAAGAKAVLRAYPEAVLNVEVDDPGVLADVDTRGDYERVIGEEFPVDPGS